jgi:hypothetical protein
VCAICSKPKSKNYFNVWDLLQGFERNCQRNRRHKLNYFNNIDDRDLIIETGTSGFTNDVLSDTSLTSSDQYADVKVSKGVRLTENDFFLQLILLYKTTKTDLLDNTFYLFKTKIESAGSIILNFKYYKQ